MENESGAEYLNIQLEIGHALLIAEQAKLNLIEGKESVNVVAFINESDKGPAYKARGIAVWKNYKKEPSVLTEDFTDGNAV